MLLDNLIKKILDTILPQHSTYVEKIPRSGKYAACEQEHMQSCIHYEMHTMDQHLQDYLTVYVSLFTPQESESIPPRIFRIRVDKYYNVSSSESFYMLESKQQWWEAINNLYAHIFDNLVKCNVFTDKELNDINSQVETNLRTDLHIMINEHIGYNFT